MYDKMIDPNSSHIIRSYATQIATQEAFRLGFERDRETGKVLMASSSVVDRGSRVDISWLPAAAEKYKISADIKDYVLCEVPIVEGGGIPNRNLHAFLSSRLTEFLPKYGCQAYQTFKAKPVHFEHQHDDETKAKGVIFDAAFRTINGRDFVFIIKGFDRTKDRELAEAVLSGKRRGHSMSAYAEAFDCSVCGHNWNTEYRNACEKHMKGPMGQRSEGRLLGAGQVYDGALSYMVVKGIVYIESSSVSDPAMWAAHQVQQVSLT